MLAEEVQQRRGRGMGCMQEEDGIGGASLGNEGHVYVSSSDLFEAGRVDLAGWREGWFVPDWFSASPCG